MNTPDTAGLPELPEPFYFASMAYDGHVNHTPYHTAEQMREYALAAVRAAQAAQPNERKAPHECKTEGEKTAFSFGWWKALESVRGEGQPADLSARLADLHLYEEVAEHYALCEISPGALRDWVADRAAIRQGGAA